MSSGGSFLLLYSALCSHFASVLLPHCSNFFLPVWKKFVPLQPISNPKIHKIMAKIYGLFGAMTGKLADVVMVVRNGEQIARKYQPIVSNPSTTAQVAQRAKLKLMAQLSAVMAPVIAMRREGAVSARNIFVRYNFRSATFDNDTADVELADIKLTKSAVSLPSLSAGVQASVLTVALSASEPTLDRVVYCLFRKENDNTLRLVGSQVVSTSGTSQTFSTTFNVSLAPHVVYAYGVRDNSERARVAFGDLEAPTAETVAKLVTSSVLLESDVTLTETRYAAPSSNAKADEENEQVSTRKKK